MTSAARFPGCSTGKQQEPADYVPRDVLLTLGSSLNTLIVTTHGSVSVAGVYAYPEDGRRPGLDWAALVPTSSSATYDECWASAWPQLSGLRQLLLGTITVDAGASIDLSSIETSQLNTSLGYNFTGATQYRSRVSLCVPVFAAIAGILAALLSVRIRRLELAARLHDGGHRQDLHWIVLLENLSWSLPALLAGTVTGALIAARAGPGPADAHNLAISAGATALAATLGAVLGGALGVALLREAHLFKYFKDR